MLTQFSEDGFVDCVFRIAAVTSDASFHNLSLRASHQGSIVGLTAIIRRGIRGGIDRDTQIIKAHVYRRAVQLVRSGSESDRFLIVLAEQYGLTAASRNMVNETSFTAIALHYDGVDMETEPIKLKLFGHDGPADAAEDYSESFFNLDLANGFVVWREKDSAYRTALLRELSASVHIGNAPHR